MKYRIKQQLSRNQAHQIENSVSFVVFFQTILVDDVDPIFVPFGVLKLTKKQDA
jgi:hypothetical protein